MVVRGGEKALVGWATTKSGDTATATVVDGSQTSHSLQLAVGTEMRDEVSFRCGCANVGLAQVAFSEEAKRIGVLPVVPVRNSDSLRLYVSA